MSPKPSVLYWQDNNDQSDALGYCGVCRYQRLPVEACKLLSRNVFSNKMWLVSMQSVIWSWNPEGVGEVAGVSNATDHAVAENTDMPV